MRVRSRSAFSAPEWTHATDLQAAGYVDPKFTFTDPWGNPYRYDPKGKRNGGKRPDIWTVTPDKTGIGNWPEQKKE